MGLFAADRERYRTLATAWVMPEPRRCVQCGVCSFNCPMGIDVRRHVWRDEPVGDSGCLTCGECVRRCPRGLLRFDPIVAEPAESAPAGVAGRTGRPAHMARRHVLIGGGPATMAAAEAIRGADADARIIVVGADSHGYYSRPGLAYFLTRELREDRLLPFTPEDVGRLGLEWITERAQAVDPASHRVTLEGGRQLVYDRLLLATGSQAIGTRVPGAELDGVVKLDGMRNARDIVRRCGDAKVAVVVGGGITALEIVEGLRARRVHVHYFMRRDRYWSNVLSASESRIVEQALRREDVEIHTFTDLAAIRGRSGRVAAAETGDGIVIPCDLVAVAVGVRPRIELARAAGLPCARGVLVDENLRTGDPDVYAAGDIAETVDPRTGHRTLEVLWNPALLKGRIAGLNMAGEPIHVYEGDAPINVTRLAGLHTTIIGTVGNGQDADLEGLSRGDSQVWSELCDAAIVEAQRGDAHIRLALGDHTIEGAVVMGDQALSYPLQELIDGSVDVTGIVAALEAPEAPIVELVNSLWADWKAGRVRAAEPAPPERRP